MKSFKYSDHPSVMLDIVQKICCKENITRENKLLERVALKDLLLMEV